MKLFINYIFILLLAASYQANAQFSVSANLLTSFSDEHSLAFSYTPIISICVDSTQGDIPVHFKYRIPDIDTNWHYTQATTIHLFDLSDGTYKFELMASSDNIHWQKSSNNLVFTIKSNNGTSLLITIIIILAFLFGIGLTFRIRKIRRAKSSSLEILKLKQVAQAPHLNPQFIFVSLNALQKHIANNDRRQSSKYLTRFSTLIRLLLNHSASEEIPIHDEIEAIQSLLELETMRLQQTFTYSMNLSDINDEFNFYIPPFVLYTPIEQMMLFTTKRNQSISPDFHLSISNISTSHQHAFYIQFQVIYNHEQKNSDIQKQFEDLEGLSIVKDRFSTLNSLGKKMFNIKQTIIINENCCNFEKQIEIKIDNID